MSSQGGSGTDGTVGSSNGGNRTAGSGTGGTSDAGNGGMLTSGAGSGGNTGMTSAGSSGAASTGSGGAASGGGNSGAGGSAGVGGSGGTRSVPFTCNLLIGPSTLGQWFNGGFLAHAGIDATRWEAMIAAHHYIPEWSPPGSTLFDTALEANQCALGSTTPDRVIFQATQWADMPVATWESHLSGIVKNIQMKWPSAKRIELMLSTVGPGNQPCSGGTAAEQSIQPAGFTALAAMPGLFPGLVSVDPAPMKWFEVTACSDFIVDHPQYTDSGARNIANLFGNFFALNP